MMTIGKFQVSINESVDLLIKMGLFKQRNPIKSSWEYSEFINYAKKNNLFQIHKYIIENHTYDILLKDDSIFQFSMSENYIRYSYIQNPYKWVSKEEYVTQILSDYELVEGTLADILRTVNDEEYQQFIDELGINSKANHFRYDYSSAEYEPLVHACSHLHIGINENLRIPVAQVISPLLFVAFCIKHTYYPEWKSKINSADPYLMSVISDIKNSESFHLTNWDEVEKNDLYII